MWIDSNIYLNDMKIIINDINIDWQLLKNKTIFITGGTGLIGSNIINALLYANMEKKLDCKIIALVRNKENAEKIFEQQISDKLEFIIGDICNHIEIEKNVDYIIHAASQTSSKEFVNNPINTIDVALDGTRNVLELAKKKNIKSMVYLSTMEVYGRPQNDKKIKESHYNNLDTTEVRNCYPISKRMCENLCVCYDVNSKIARLTQTFGPGVDYNDNRVFAQFGRCVIENKDIVLKTKGDTKRSYLYTADAVRAILTILLQGENNEAYNVANEKTYCSILEMAELVREKCANNRISIKYETEENISNLGYAPKLCMNLDTQKLQKLGWKPNFDLENMFNNMIKTM